MPQGKGVAQGPQEPQLGAASMAQVTTRITENCRLVGGFNSSEYGMIILNIWENKKCSKPPTRKALGCDGELLVAEELHLETAEDPCAEACWPHTQKRDGPGV